MEMQIDHPGGVDVMGSDDPFKQARDSVVHCWMTNRKEVDVYSLGLDRDQWVTGSGSGPHSPPGTLLYAKE